MPTIKASYVMSGPYHGWRETWYFQQTSQNLTDAFPTWVTTLESRRQLLGAQCQIKAVECSIVLDDAGNPVIDVSAPDYVFKNGYTQEDSADLDVALIINASILSRNKSRNVFMRGIWDSIETMGGVYSAPPTGLWATKFASWVATMKAIGVGYIATTKAGPFAITGYTQLVDEQVQLTFAAPGPWAAGVPQAPVQIRINTARQSSKLAGLKVVQPLSATTAVTIDKIAVYPFTGVGWRAFTYTRGFVLTPNIDARRIGRRAVGRPLLVTAGRAKASPLG